ncbi:MAG: hypothetical protein M3N48_10120 [Verrucomicrobiota bacterium]|nr:hypothetical protein [Verrucomicrobiota bacterium]
MSHFLRICVSAFLVAGVGVLLAPRRIWREPWRRITALGRWLGDETPRRRRTVLILIWIVALIPMVHLTYLVRHYAVEVPTLDDWEMAPLIVDAHSGHLKWADFFAQQQEGRTILPRLIFILSAAGGHWDVRDQMMLSVVCCWLTASGIFILLRRTVLGLGAVGLCFALAALTIFSPAQFELWIFASGFPSFLPVLFVVAGLVVIGTNISTAWKFIWCGLFATASSFSLPHGLLAWGLTFPALFLIRKVPRWRSWLLAWIVLCAACATIYFWDYHKPPDLPGFAPSTPLGEYVLFILEFLGGGFAYAVKNRPDLMAAIFGAVQCGLFFAALVYCARRIRDRIFLAKCAPWFALASYSFGSAGLAALGRVAYGARYALASRYVAFSIYLTIALIALLAIVVREILAGQASVRARAWLYGVSAVLVIGYLVPYKVGAFNTTFFLRALSAKDRLARGAVLLSPVIDTTEIIKRTAYPNNARPVTNGAEALDRLRLLRPPLIRTNRVDRLPHESADGRRASGSCESLTPLEGNLIRAGGWAVLDAKGRPPDCVAVAYRIAADQPWTLCAISDSFAMRPEIVKRLRTMEQLWTGWSATLAQNAFPPGAQLSFWAVDADEPRLYQLRDESGVSTR